MADGIGFSEPGTGFIPVIPSLCKQLFSKLLNIILMTLLAIGSMPALVKHD